MSVSPGQLRLTTAKRLSACMSSRALATTTTSSFLLCFSISAKIIQINWSFLKMQASKVAPHLFWATVCIKDWILYRVWKSVVIVVWSDDTDCGQTHSSNEKRHSTQNVPLITSTRPLVARLYEHNRNKYSPVLLCFNCCHPTSDVASRQQLRSSSRHHLVVPVDYSCVRRRHSGAILRHFYLLLLTELQ